MRLYQVQMILRLYQVQVYIYMWECTITNLTGLFCHLTNPRIYIVQDSILLNLLIFSRIKGSNNSPILLHNKSYSSVTICSKLYILYWPQLTDLFLIIIYLCWEINTDYIVNNSIVNHSSILASVITDVELQSTLCRSVISFVVWHNNTEMGSIVIVVYGHKQQKSFQRQLHLHGKFVICIYNCEVNQ